MTDAPPITRWPIPKHAPALLFGGSFDPPHRAHAEIAAAARDGVMPKDAWLVLVPAARSPHKADRPGASDDHRIAMLGLAFEGIERVAIWTDELDRARPDIPSYWSDTLARCAAARGSIGGLRFLIGADQAVAFHKWHEARAILSKADPIVVPRGDVRTPDDLDRRLADTRAWTDAARTALRECWFDVEVRPESSTRVRMQSHRGDLTPAVADYIDRHGLYSDRVSDDDAP